MGRVRLNMRKLESSSNRQVTYCKRRAGILKKAKEISVVCDSDILLLMFSPTGKPTLFLGERSNFDEIIAKFAQLTPQERAKRKLESLETLRKTFKKLDHDVGVQEFLDASDPSVEELHNQVKVLQSRLTDVEKRLSRQDEQTLTCHPANNSQNIPFPVAPNFLTQGDMGCSGDTSVAECSHVLDSGKELELDRARQTTAMLDDTVWDDLNSIACLRQQLSEPYSYYPCDNLNLLERKSLDSQSEVDLRGYLMDYEIQRNFNLPRSVDSVNNSWDSAAGASAAPILDEKSYPQFLDLFPAARELFA
ncbi:agamous-like mads-box protein agl65 [Nicotiana attenuata]|uniref:Agamous-like mads-box protein agl65 n=1 Tax=Nicotiana attenuata TaxID=49451 RepID=A0A1J6KBM1_NICAT|nr:agamous-like mads-box protein agl65 [Nicotiana attenuata]